ncbi:HypA-like protein [Penicillium fimorum]|uniref:HypA-like protein n=1 Tax=Penicillium fimorum TaxID=1882269 RepID=A0A9X0CB10_9EURO|nr:HypA-like protein [Penicillium fimorum]
MHALPWASPCMTPAPTIAIMHMGLGVDFNQPSILAEGLAETVVHNEPWCTEYHELCRAMKASVTTADRLSLLDVYNAYTKDLCDNQLHGLGPRCPV